jgi:hypothetical protein
MSQPDKFDTDLASIVTIQEAQEGLQKAITYLQTNSTLHVTEEHIQTLLVILSHLFGQPKLKTENETELQVQDTDVYDSNGNG